MMRIERVFPIVLAAMSSITPAFAQTCASPTTITVPSAPVSGNTCNRTNQLPYLANGAIASPAKQDVYQLDVADGTGVTVSLIPEASFDGTLFVCRNVCSTVATCVAAVDGGGAGQTEMASLPAGAGDYYVVVGGVASGCGNYVLQLNAPVGRPDSEAH